MTLKDLEHLKIANRRRNDIVIIVRHDYFVEKHKNEIVVEYINEYGQEFFNFSEIPNEEKLLFNSLLSNKTKHILFENLDYEAQNHFLDHDLPGVIRRIANFTVLDKSHHQVLMNIKIFHLYNEVKTERKKTVDSKFYYLILHSTELETKISSFRTGFLDKINAQIVFDPLNNIPNFQSTLNELKMITKFYKKNEGENITIISIKLNDLHQDQVLFSSIIDSLLHSTRATDFIGNFGDNQLLAILYNCTLANAEKALQRIRNIVASNKYIYDNYNLHRKDLLSIGYTSLQHGDDIDILQKKLDSSSKYQ